MSKRQMVHGLIVLVSAIASSRAGEREVVSLHGFCDQELKMVGLGVSRPVDVHIKAMGAGGNQGWTYKSDQMFAAGWIINADTRKLVWKMDVDNTSSTRKNREFDDRVRLQEGNYEVYFAVPTFGYHTTFTHININVDHRDQPLFRSYEKHEDGVFSFFKDWWSDDVAKEWEKRCAEWGIDVLVDEASASHVRMYGTPRDIAHAVIRLAPLHDGALKKQGFELTERTTLQVYGLGEATGDQEMHDFAWIVNAHDRTRVWEPDHRKQSHAGGAEKNAEWTGEVTLEKGQYVVYCVTDDSHSPDDWNSFPPYDPMNWGMTLSVRSESEKKNVRLFTYREDQNVIVSLTKVKDEEHRSEGFTLKEDARVRIYAFGERSNARRLMADYGTIIDARTRTKVWTMDVDKSWHAGGASKNRYLDEVIELPRGSYIVTYNTDDSHSYDDWNSQPPFDPEFYGITVMGAGPRYNPGIVTRYAERQDKNVIAQITRVRDDADEEKRFRLDRPSRVRIYAIGEGEKRQMFDYGWIEDASTGSIVWEMTYAMTFHAGGGRKNRMVNTSLLLEKGDYLLRYVADDSHSFNDWNVDPPEDQEYWGITVFRDDGTERVQIPEVPRPPQTPE
jgi:hypothetical protein